MKVLYACVLLMCLVKLSVAEEVTSLVKKVGSGWEADTACVYLSSGNVVKLDLTTQKGRAELSIALSAKAKGDSLYVYFRDAEPLVGGCNTGTTVKSHGILILQ